MSIENRLDRMIRRSSCMPHSKQTSSRMLKKSASIVIALLLAIGLNVTSERSELCAEETSRHPIQLSQLNQTPRKNPFLEGGQIVRPSLKEREAVHQMLALKPRPKTLKDADVRFLQELRDKGTWFAFDQRMMHEIWSEVNGKKWNDAR
jgi:hypothetical protein